MPQNYYQKSLVMFRNNSSCIWEVIRKVGHSPMTDNEFTVYPSKISLNSKRLHFQSLQPSMSTQFCALYLFPQHDYKVSVRYLWWGLQHGTFYNVVP
jgi:hypothetical protein